MLKSSRRSQNITCFLIALLTVMPLGAQAAITTYYNTLFAFDQSQTAAGVIEGSDGALYGTTSNTSITSGGLIYRISVSGGTPQTLYQLGRNDTDGYSPRADLLLASDGYLYGTTHYGRRLGSNYDRGSGTVFRIKQDGSAFETLHYFSDATDSNSQVNDDGIYPDAALIEGGDGYLYGVTTYGGAYGKGTVFRIAKDGSNFILLHVFVGLDGAGINGEGALPGGKLLLASDGHFYGVTTNGGSAANGTVYRLSATGTGFAAIHNFSTKDDSGYNDDGATPTAALLEVDDVIYGVTTSGGAAGYGTVYSLTAEDDTVTTLHHFGNSSEVSDGAIPQGSLTLAEDGRLYGMTSSGVEASGGVTTSSGTIFAMATDGSDYELLHGFTSSEGTSPQSGLLKANSSTYFGTLSSSGPCSAGAVFRLSLSGSLKGDGKISCETSGSEGDSSSGGGAMGGGWLFLLFAFGHGLCWRRWSISAGQ